MKRFVLSALLFPALALAQPASMQQQFQTPPKAAKPRVWWHWMNGNITKEGIQKDLDWMNRVGIGGVQNFDANFLTPVVVPKKIVFMTPEWKEVFRFTTDYVRKLNFEMAIAGSPGWSETGGPWVPPADGMKKYVWTETRIAGGQSFAGKLPQPANTTGNFQNVPLAAANVMGDKPENLPTYYADAAVIAYRLPDADKTLTALNPTVTSSGGTFTLAQLTDNNLANETYLPPAEVGKDAWIQYAFATPQTFKALAIVGATHTPTEQFFGAPENRALQVSDDGVTFREVVKIPGSIVPQNTVAFAPTTGKYFRFTWKTLQPQPNFFAAMAGGSTDPGKPVGVGVAELHLYNTDRIHLFEDKAGFFAWREDSLLPTAPRRDAIPTADVVDLTGKMTADGSLNWTAPAGNWIIVRLGYSLTGRQNHPASPEATGLEVDKLDGEAVRKYINTYLDMYADATGGKLGPNGLEYIILDSYEAGHMTWTKALPDEFRKRRGYALTLWIPVLTGRVVQSLQASEQFLWDFRKTIGELIAENHYDLIGEELKKRGMKRYTESQEDKRVYFADGMDVKRNADVPMSAMWTPGSLASGSGEEVRSMADIRESASVAHIYGKPFVAAESMTSVQNAFTFHPEKLKRTADMELASGLNRFVIHTSVHQPLDDKKPGFSLGPFGQYFTRQETWAEQAKPWVSYLSRSCYLLQQGKAVVDVLHYYGENNNITWAFRDKLPTVPGYEFDFVNSTALLNAVSVQNGRLVTPGGMAYSLLVLDETARQMTLPVLKKIGELVKAGAKVTGVKPERSPSLSDNPGEFTALVNQIWSSPNVLVGKPAADVLKAAGVAEDVIITKNQTQSDPAPVLYQHRQTADRDGGPTDIYWLDNRGDATNDATVSFRVVGKVPELWNPQTGQIERVSYQIRDGRTTVPLHFESWDAYFIVFRDRTSATTYTKPATTETPVLTISSPWTVNFTNGPQTVSFASLTSWTDNANAGVKYFSGTAAYQTTFTLGSVLKNGQYVIDLGDVKNLAEVLVNGKNVGIAWKKPFRLNLTNAVKQGTNSLEVRVTNLWPNRLIGDAQPEPERRSDGTAGVKTKTTFTTLQFYQASSPLLPSGLLGPVRVLVDTPK